jgi:hypothetical protein
MEYFTPAYLAVAGFFGMIGMGACMYGKKAADVQSLVIGAILCGLSYFVTDPVTLAIASSIFTVLLFSRQITRGYYDWKQKDIEIIK